MAAAPGIDVDAVPKPGGPEEETTPDMLISTAYAQAAGGGSAFDEAIAAFAEAYADQNERDYAALAAAAESGRIVAETAP